MPRPGQQRPWPPWPLRHFRRDTDPNYTGTEPLFCKTIKGNPIDDVTSDALENHNMIRSHTAGQNLCVLAAS